MAQLKLNIRIKRYMDFFVSLDCWTILEMIFIQFAEIAGKVHNYWNKLILYILIRLASGILT